MCPGSHIRHAGGRPLGVEARKYKYPAARPFMVEVGWSRGASKPWGRSIKRIAAAS